MTEFDKWRVARQEAEQLLQQLREGPHEPQPIRRPGAAHGLGLARPAAAMRAAALRLLRPGAR